MSSLPISPTTVGGWRLAAPAAATGVDRIATLLACLFAAEVILGGPGYWMVGGVSLRKALFMLNLAWFGLSWATGRFRMRHGELMLMAGLLIVSVIWIGLVPLVRNPGQLPMAFQDGSPLATLMIGVFFAAFFRHRPGPWRLFVRTVAASLGLVAAANIGLWAIGMSSEAGNFIAQGIALYWFTLGNLDLAPPLYVGVMPDGFFRVMWITAILYVPALLFCIAARRGWGIVLFTLALLATYTRALWLAALIAVLLAQLLSTRRERFVDVRIVLAMLLLGGLAAPVMLFSSLAADQDGLLGVLAARLGSSFSDSSANERFEQVGPLIDAWMRAPFFGLGFGAQASLIRSDEAPYSYELTVLALLMKVGVAGLLVLMLGFGTLWASAAVVSRTADGRRSREACAGLAAAVAFLLAASTNPFLLNFVGMSVMGYLFLRLQLERPAASERRRGTAPVSAGRPRPARRRRPPAA